jgi:hypothetical protein
MNPLRLMLRLMLRRQRLRLMRKLPRRHWTRMQIFGL